jgi:hypothetical protein
MGNTHIQIDFEMRQLEPVLDDSPNLDIAVRHEEDSIDQIWVISSMNRVLSVST